MAYKIAFVINGRSAVVDESFDFKRDAQEVAAGIEQEGYPTEIFEED